MTNTNIQTIKIKQRFKKLQPFLSEKQIRLWAAVESETFGYGGISAVAQETGVSRRAITMGHKELSGQCAVEHERTRRLGGGRKKITEKDQNLKVELEKLIDPFTRGDPESPLRWTAKSIRNLADALKNRGHSISHQVVANLLREMGYSLQANKKTIEGGSHPDRNAQFEYINQKVKYKLLIPAIPAEYSENCFLSISCARQSRCSE